LFHQITLIIAFGGLSGAGKSSIAQGTGKLLESKGISCTRLKIEYFMEQASMILGSDAYLLPEEHQAQLLVKHLNYYLRWHDYYTVIILESLHRLKCTQQLKHLLGDLLKIIYIETSLENRLARSTGSDVNEKDKAMISHEADKIKDIPDTFLLHNDNTNINESIYKVYEHVLSKHKSLYNQALLSQVYTGKINLFSHQFVLSAGSVLIQKSTGYVCILHTSDGRKEWLLPKGRKNVGEALYETAVRETYEETGYQCSLIPLTMETRATLNEEPVGDVSRLLKGVCEPFAISLRQIGGKSNNQKIIFWYVTQVEKSRELNTQMENESFNSRLMPYTEALNLLTYEDDKEMLTKAYQLYQQSRY